MIFFNGWSVPGVFFGVTDSLGNSYSEVELLDTIDYTESCEYGDRFEYSDSLYTGLYDVWFDCGNTESIYLALVATPADRSYLIFVGIIAVTQADLEAIDTILDTFIVR